ncbi:hypothetical protein HPB49_002664 [Dermacentor silvarum]|uniref:Uncharacterized protein n=1 Tax=Dermacentor silvarum TaxID=543639 RepID=A0ACB8CCY1_DERSI|nr:hypothetical protein HPB49_002664 [Dermacentor silvarum]
MLPRQAAVGFAFLTVLVIGTHQVELKAGCKIETLRACGDDYVPYAYRKAVGCMNSVGTKINACLKGFHSLVQRAVVKAQAKHVIGHACCSYHDALDCLRNALTPCDSAGSIEFATGLLGKVFGETLHLVCGEHTEGSEACKTLPEVPKLGPRDRKIDNYVELLVEVASKLHSEHLLAAISNQLMRLLGQASVNIGGHTIQCIAMSSVRRMELREGTPDV